MAVSWVHYYWPVTGGFTKASDGEFRIWFWSAPEQKAEQTIGDLRRHRAHYQFSVMNDLFLPKSLNEHDHNRPVVVKFCPLPYYVRWNYIEIRLYNNSFAQIFRTYVALAMTIHVLTLH